MPNDEPDQRVSPYGPRDRRAVPAPGPAPAPVPAPEPEPEPEPERSSFPIWVTLIAGLIALLLLVGTGVWPVETSAPPVATPTSMSPLPPERAGGVLAGGAPASFGRLVVGYDDHLALVCSGVVVGPNADRVVTAAWCVDRPDSDAAIDRIEFATPFDVVGGPIRVFPGDQASVFVHPEFDPETQAHDLAVVRIGPDEEGGTIPAGAAAAIEPGVAADVDAIAYGTTRAAADTPAELTIEETTIAGCASPAVYGTSEYLTALVLACPRGVISRGGPVYARPTDAAGAPGAVVAIMSHQRSAVSMMAPDFGEYVIATPIDQVIVDVVMRA